jgi:hypothetical protein
MMVACLVRDGTARQPWRSFAASVTEQIEQVTKDLVTDLSLFGILRTQCSPQSDPDVDDKDDYDGCDKDEHPDDLGTDLRHQAEQHC